MINSPFKGTVPVWCQDGRACKLLELNRYKMKPYTAVIIALPRLWHTPLKCLQLHIHEFKIIP